MVVFKAAGSRKPNKITGDKKLKPVPKGSKKVARLYTHKEYRYRDGHIGDKRQIRLLRREHFKRRHAERYNKPDLIKVGGCYHSNTIMLPEGSGVSKNNTQLDQIIYNSADIW